MGQDVQIYVVELESLEGGPQGAGDVVDVVHHFCCHEKFGSVHAAFSVGGAC